MNRRSLMAGAAALAAAASFPGASAGSRPVDPRAAVLDVIASWYRALRERDERALFALIGPMALIEHDLTHCRDPLSRMCDVVFAPDFLAFGALRFTTEIRQIEVQETLARVLVLVRAWFPSQSGDYERAAYGDFYLRRWPDRGWLVAVAGERTTALP